MSDKRTPPHDLDAERAVIGACLLTRQACTAALEVLTPGDFYAPKHQTVFDAIRVLHTADESVDPVTVNGHLEHDDLAWLHEVTVDTPSVSAVGRYAGIVLGHAKSRALLYIGADLTDAGYRGDNPLEVAQRIATILGDSELLNRHEAGVLRGYHDDILGLDSGEDRDEAQPWISTGVLRRGQRMLVVAKAGLGKSVMLRQLAFCAENGVHPWTGQPTEKPRRALIVELEAGAWDITSSMRDLLFGMQRSRQLRSAFDADRPALLHRPEGLDIRSSAGLAALEAAIQRTKPSLVVMGPIKYLSLMKPGENYETAALHLHALLNTLMARYRFALAMEAHFSRGDHGAPGGSERWVDWPDVGFSMHPPDDNLAARFVPGGAGVVVTAKQFRIPRDSAIWVPDQFIRGANKRLPWSADDGWDTHAGGTVYTERWNGHPGDFYEQQEF